MERLQLLQAYALALPTVPWGDDMPTEVIVAIIAFAGTALGSLGGVIASARLTTYRIEQLEKKVEKHNSVVERVTLVEQSTKSAHHRIDDIEDRLVTHSI